MANPQRGEVPLKVGDRTYTLKLDMDAICTLEGILSTPQQLVTLADVFTGVLRNSHVYARALLWALLRRHHADVTLGQAGDLLLEMGGITKFINAVSTVKESTQPDAQDRPARPPRARRSGTGARTTSTPAASD